MRVSGAALAACLCMSAATTCLVAGWEEPDFLRGRYAPGVAFDSARGVMVVFGGMHYNEPLNDLWEWNGSAWTHRTPALSPSARGSAAMVYDSARSRIVLFGGSTGGSYLNDTWEWDGSTWTQRTPPLNPPTGIYSMAYDSLRQRTVMFGGSYTWEWDGDVWTRGVAAQGQPSGPMTYDSARARVVVFGGYQYGQQGGFTWEYDGASWTQRSPTVSPPARYGHAMAYDEVRHRVVLYGGTDAAANPRQSLNDAWEWDGTTWMPVSQGPPPLSGHGMVFDSARSRIVLFGGSWQTLWYKPSVAMAAVWEWDGSQWVQRTATGDPPPRKGLAMAYDSGRGRTVMFGGTTGGSNGEMSDTWEWDGSGWKPVQPISTGVLTVGYAMAYDGGRVIRNGNGATLAWTGTGWMSLTTAGPPARIDHAMAYDSARHRVVLFGGTTDGYTAFDDTWEWNGSAWTQANPSVKPPARFWHAMAYDSARHRVVLFGGTPNASAALDDTWEWDGTQWTQATPAASPPARYQTALVFDSAHGRTVLFGGHGASTLSDTWEWDGTQWTARAPLQSPQARGAHAMAYDEARHRAVLFGGDAGGPHTWTYSGGCGDLDTQPAYGMVLFDSLCTAAASGLTQDVYAATTANLHRAAHDRFYLSSAPAAFAPLVVDDAVHVNGLDSGLGPWTPQPGRPPYAIDEPIEENFVPLPATDVTGEISPGLSPALFELLNTDRQVYGHTTLYLVADCGLTAAGSPATLNFISSADQMAGRPPEFDVRYGLLSQVRATRDFSTAVCLGHFFDTPASPALPDPPVGDGWYFLARGLSNPACNQYGDSSLVPDPRRDLDAAPVCP